MIKPQPKPVKYKNEQYLEWMRKQPCSACLADMIVEPGEPHHIRRAKWGAGTGTKPHDYVTISLCRKHHDLFQKNRPLEMDMPIDDIIIDNLMRYIESKRK